MDWVWDWSESLTYPVAGAFIERLRIKGSDQKLKALVQDQTLESAYRIYGPELTVWITEFEQELCGQEHVGGIGIELGQENKTCKIVKVLPNSPPSKAGLLPGLIVHEVDGVATGSKLLKDCVDMVRGAAGTKVQLN